MIMRDVNKVEMQMRPSLDLIYEGDGGVDISHQNRDFFMIIFVDHNLYILNSYHLIRRLCLKSF